MRSLDTISASTMLPASARRCGVVREKGPCGGCGRTHSEEKGARGRGVSLRPKGVRSRAEEGGGVARADQWLCGGTDHDQLRLASGDKHDSGGRSCFVAEDAARARMLALATTVLVQKVPKNLSILPPRCARERRLGPLQGIPRWLGTGTGARACVHCFC